MALPGLASSSARWNVIAQQTMMAQYDYDPSETLSVNHDQWDGYVVSRNRLTNFIDQQAPANPVVLSGDWHSAFVNEVLLDHANPDSRKWWPQSSSEPQSAPAAAGLRRSRTACQRTRTPATSTRTNAAGPDAP